MAEVLKPIDDIDSKKLEEQQAKEKNEKQEEQNIVKGILDFTPGSPESGELKNKDGKVVLKAFQEEVKNKSSNLNDEQKKQIETLVNGINPDTIGKLDDEKLGKMQDVLERVSTLQKSFANQSLDYQQKQREQEKSYKDLLTSIDSFKSLFKKDNSIKQQELAEQKNILPDAEKKLGGIENVKKPSESSEKQKEA